jgi:hypothetical protein
MPMQLGAWPTVLNRFRQWRDAGVFAALLDGLIAEAATCGGVDPSHDRCWIGPHPELQGVLANRLCNS